ncbi:BatA domain-containing protein [Alienimonas chondri]|uniref:Aerotolerance regulator N-terminal domain-containing protein n=1 Tax=Alienimonas chondri TaxID=2681879 RepID=A0ABX1V9I6_9PLAN|nr:BatA domain-containing protein [Alienimonas chondri]NNJ24581.1 hypothetical protein [Alienimonas chondri]
MISFANPWGLLGLLAVPAVLWLHLYRVRFPPMAVGGLFLWDDAIRRPAGGRTRDRLRSTASLWLELFAALALGLLLGGPRVSWETTAPHLVVALDGSASMGATAAPPAGDEAAPTFRDAALAELRERASAKGGRTLLTVIETGDRPRVVGGPRRPWRAVLEELAARPAPTRPRHEFAPSLDLAARLVADGGEILLLTDRDPRSLEFSEDTTAVSVGAPRPNVVLLAADRRPSDGAAGEELFLRWTAFGRVGPVTVTVRDDAGESLFRRTIPSASGESVTNAVPLPPLVANQPVTVRLTAAEDALEADSMAVLLPSPARPVRVAVSLPPGRTRTAIERAVAALPNVIRTDLDAADLRFVSPDPLASDGGSSWLVVVGSLPGEGEAIDTAGPFLIDRADPLAAGVSLAGAVWGGAGQGTALTREDGTFRPISPVIAAGDRVLAGRVVGADGVFVLNVDAARGTLANTPDWPILLSNLVEARRAALPGPDRANLRVGESARLTLTERQHTADGPLVLRSLEGSERIELPRERTMIIAPPGVGLWSVWNGGANGEDGGRPELARFAVRLADPREGDLTSLASGVVEPDAEDAAGTTVDDPAPWLVALLAVAALAAFVGDWWATRPA